MWGREQGEGVVPLALCLRKSWGALESLELLRLLHDPLTPALSPSKGEREFIWCEALMCSER
jgi:hypothetical protein